MAEKDQPETSSHAGQDEAAIVVTGHRDEKGAARQFVKDVTERTDDQVARFSDEICVVAYGLPEGHGSIVAERVETIARGLGVPSAGRDCRPNVILAFASEGAPFLSLLKRSRPHFFRGLDLPDVRRLLATGGPVWAWHSVSLRGADGRPAEAVSSLNIDGRIVYLGKNSHLVSGTGLSSRLQRTTRQDLAASFLLFDIDALDGLTLTQIADYAAMRALARTRPDAFATRSTILSLFSGKHPEAGPDGLTRWDSAYLKSLYRSSHSLTASHQQSEMATILRRELEREKGEKR